MSAFPLLLLIPERLIRRIPHPAWATAFVLILFLPLLFPSVGGARRWIDLGALNVHAAMLVLPALLVILGSMAKPLPALFLAAAALCLQPDLSQLAALSLSSLPIILKKREKPLLCAVSLVLLAALCIVCALRPVSLEPVEYCEGILLMLLDMSPVLFAAGAASLALIPGSLLLSQRRKRCTPLLCLALYYAASVLSVPFGNSPTPFMGFGLSPIAGYCLAIPLFHAFDDER